MRAGAVSLLLAAALISAVSCAPKSADATQDVTSLARHPFVYAGEWDTRHPEKQTLCIIRDGKVVWEYSHPLYGDDGRIQEFDDVTLLPNGNVVFAAMSLLGIVSPEGELVWTYRCPEGTESHSCQPIDEDHVVFALNGHPGKIVTWDVKNDVMVSEVIVETAEQNTHGQFRHVRTTPEGNFVTGLIHEQLAIEINPQGEIVWSAPAQSPWSVVKLHNGNYLIGGDSHSYVREVAPDGSTVWELTQEDVPFKLYNTQTACRLENGNTVICNWVAGQPEEEWAGTVQVFEVTPEKEVVWQVSEWDDPDLGPATYVHLLDEPGSVYGGQQR